MAMYQIVRAEGFLWASSAATAAAVYSVAVTTSSGKDASFVERNSGSTAAAVAKEVKIRSDCGAGRYAPRFDGLRFIETLVTAHR